METPTPAQVNPNAIKPGIRTTQFWLLAGVIALGAWFVYADKINGTAFELGSLVAWIVYQIARQGLYRDAATHPNDALDQQLKTVFDLVSPKSEHVPAIIAALKGTPQNSTPNNTIEPKAEVSPGSVATPSPAPVSAPSAPVSGQAGFALLQVLGWILIVGAVALLCTSCSTNTGNAQKDRTARVTNQVLLNLGSDAFQIAIGALSNAVITAANGDTHGRDLQQSAATGAWKSVGSINVASDVEKIINAWNGGSAPKVAQAAAVAFQAAGPVTQSDKAAVVNIIAAKIDTSAAKAGDSKAIVPPQAGRSHPKPYAWPQPASMLRRLGSTEPGFQPWFFYPRFPMDFPARPWHPPLLLTPSYFETDLEACASILA
jgi:hypothetical protein